MSPSPYLSRLRELHLRMCESDELFPTENAVQKSPRPTPQEIYLAELRKIHERLDGLEALIRSNYKA